MLTIGQFAERTRLSARALRLYDELDLLTPARVDPDSGYRLYTEGQVGGARLVALCRGIGMPLAAIGPILRLDPPDAARTVAEWWQQVEAKTAERRALVAYLQARLMGEDPTMYDVSLREIPERRILGLIRHVTAGGADAFFDDAFARLRRAATGLEGIVGAPYLIFYGEVSEDGDGPLELCRPVAPDTAGAALVDLPDVTLRREPAHEEAYIRLTPAESTWPALLPALESLERWAREHGRQAAGPLREVLIANERTAAGDRLTVDWCVPLR